LQFFETEAEFCLRARSFFSQPTGDHSPSILIVQCDTSKCSMRQIYQVRYLIEREKQAAAAGAPTMKHVVLLIHLPRDTNTNNPSSPSNPSNNAQEKVDHSSNHFHVMFSRHWSTCYVNKIEQ
jgi:hypothetical protein